MSFAQAYFLLAAIWAAPALMLLVPAWRAPLAAFPHSRSAGFALFAVAAAWFLYEITLMGEAELAGVPRNAMLGVFGVAAVASFWLLPDMLGVRGLAGLLLLAAHPALDAGFGRLPASLPLAFATYAMILFALFTGTAPHLLDSLLGRCLASSRRASVSGFALLAVAIMCVVCGALNLGA